MNTKRCLTALLALLLALPLVAGAAPPPGETPDHIAFTPDEVKWMPAPPVLPEGVQIAVLKGNPSAEGFSIVRLKMPPRTMISPHWHPTAENFTVLRGTLHIGMGDKVDKSMTEALPPMSFGSLPAIHHHYAYAGDETVVIDLSFYGPFQIHYVNPADDPSRQGAMKH